MQTCFMLYYEKCKYICGSLWTCSRINLIPVMNVAVVVKKKKKKKKECAIAEPHLLSMMHGNVMQHTTCHKEWSDLLRRYCHVRPHLSKHLEQTSSTLCWVYACRTHAYVGICCVMTSDQVFVGQSRSGFLLPQDSNVPTMHLITPNLGPTHTGTQMGCKCICYLKTWTLDRQMTTESVWS